MYHLSKTLWSLWLLCDTVCSSFKDIISYLVQTTKTVPLCSKLCFHSSYLPFSVVVSVSNSEFKNWKNWVLKNINFWECVKILNTFFFLFCYKNRYLPWQIFLESFLVWAITLNDRNSDRSVFFLIIFWMIWTYIIARMHGSLEDN